MNAYTNSHPSSILLQKLKIGRVEGIELNKKPVNIGKKGQDVCIKVTGDSSIQYGRHFDATHKLYSQISRASIDVMKAHFREDLETHAKLIVHLKKVLNII